MKDDQEETEASKKKKKPKRQRAAGYPGFFRVIFGYMKAYRKSVIIAVVVSMVTGIFVALMPHFIKFIVDDCIEPALAEGVPREKAWGLLWLAGLACLGYTACSAARIFLWKWGLHSNMVALEGVIFRIRSDFFDHIQHMCMRFYDKSPSGELFNCIMGSPMANIKTFLHSLVLATPYQFVSFVISVTALLWYDWLLTAVLLGTSLVMVAVTRMSRKKIRVITKDFLSSEATATKYISDMLHGMDAIKVYAIEDNTMQTFDRYLVDMKDKGVRHTFTVANEAQKPEFVQYIGTALVYFVGAYSCIMRGMTVGTLYAFLSCMSIILSTLNSWLSLFLNYNSADEGLEKIYQVMEEHTTTPDLLPEQAHSVEVERQSALRNHKPCIAFRGVNFAYDRRDIFHDFNCEIAFGESVALVGSSGSGKSTLTKLLLRLYEVDAGHVELYGRDVREYRQSSMRHCFGVVPQNPFIFYGTIWDNIRIAAPEASNYDIIKAMEVAHVHEFVNQLPEGWSTVIGDGALSLSGGQKQRIAIARAILKNPDILIFDEATSALDNLSERHIQEAMEGLMKNHTVIIIAHRLSTIRNVDRILVFDEGEIVEEGDYDTLAAGNGTFRHLLDCTEDEEEGDAFTIPDLL